MPRYYFVTNTLAYRDIEDVVTVAGIAHDVELMAVDSLAIECYTEREDESMQTRQDCECLWKVHAGSEQEAIECMDSIIEEAMREEGDES